jgi:hypothetical protein
MTEETLAITEETLAKTAALVDCQRFQEIELIEHFP